MESGGKKRRRVKMIKEQIELNFNKNYNNKLNCDIFTTIRRNNFTNRNCSELKIMLNEEYLFDAEVIDRKIYDHVNHIPDHILILDTGIVNIYDAIKLIKSFYKDDKLVLLIIKKR